MGVCQRGWKVAVGDVSVLTGVVILGMGWHGRPLDLSAVVAVVLPFAAAWILVVWCIGYHRWATRWADVWKAWAVSFPIALFFRILLTGRAVPLSFAAVTFLTQGIALSLWRWTGGRYLLRERSP